MAKFSTVSEFLAAVSVPERRAKVEDLLSWVAESWPELELAIKWNQPMFLHHGTYIIGFSVFPKNIAVGPEIAMIDRFRKDIEASGYTTTQRLFRIAWNDPIDYALLTRIVDTQIVEKSTLTTLWRP